MISQARASRRLRAAASVSLVSLLALALLLAACACAAGEQPRLKGKVVILIVDRVGMQDFPAANTPFCSGLAERWSYGAMVTRTAEREGSKELDLGAEFVTLGGGARSRGAPSAGWSYDAAEVPDRFGSKRTAGELYRSFTGLMPPAESAVCLGFQQVFRNNGKNGTSGNVGLMGRLLAAGGLRASVAGNSDSLHGRFRPAPLVCCDERGMVPAGALSGAAVAADAPGGFRTDYRRLFADCAGLLPASDVLVVDTGDTGRIDREWAQTAEGQLERERSLALGRFDGFAARVASMLDLDSSVLLVVSPGAPTEARSRGDYLTPIIAAGGGFGRGLLSSPTTRRGGLVNNIDILPTVLARFGLTPPSGVVGARMKTTAGPADAVARLKGLDRQFEATRKARWPVVIVYLVLVGLVTAVSVLTMPGLSRRIGWSHEPARLARWVPPAATALLAGPLSFLVVSAFHYEGYLFPVLFCGAFIVVVGAGAYLLCRGRRRMDPVVSVCLLTAGVILVDALFGGRLVILPLLGDSALEGSRMYGLSNSIVAVLLATAVWGMAGLAGQDLSTRRRARWWTLAALLALCFIIGYGGGGANVGGFIAALATSLTFFAATSSRRLGARTAGWIAAVTAAGTAGMILLDAAFSRTHAGRVASGGSASLLPLVQRKLGILAGQIGYLLLPALLLIAAAAAAVLWLRSPGSRWSRAWERDRSHMAAYYSLAVGSVVALVFNDTGIAMMGMIAVVSMLAGSYYASFGSRPGAPRHATPAG